MKKGTIDVAPSQYLEIFNVQDSIAAPFLHIQEDVFASVLVFFVNSATIVFEIWG